MATLEDIKLLQKNRNNWVDLNEFLMLLRRYSKPSDTAMKRSNIIKQCQKARNGLLEQSPLHINYFQVLKFIIDHKDSIYVCNVLSKQIETRVLNKSKAISNRDFETVLSLYQEIKKTDLEIFILPTDINNLEISTLHGEYKHLFDEVTWTKICKFENYFSRFCQGESEEFEAVVHLKWKTFAELVNVKKISRNIADCSRKIINDRQVRRKAKEEQYAISIKCSLTHILIEQALTANLREIFPYIDQIALCNHELSMLENRFDIYIQLGKSHGVQDYEHQEVSEWSISWLRRKHSKYICF